ncbi:MAG: PVC-type heme-binding CxxCH protein [Pirellulaceae bacterium]
MSKYLAKLALVLSVLVFSGDVAAQVKSTAQEPATPVVAQASNEAAAALSTFRLAAGLRAELVAAEPMVANPVAFTIDDQGRIYVCETFRQEQGVTDNRSHDETWVDRDLAAMTVADRIQYHRELLPSQGLEYTRQDDRIRVLIDSDGNGIVDQAQVFSNRYNNLEDGTAAGILKVGDDVWLTCIPHLWKLRDVNNDGVADERISVQDGFGVRVAFRGHDMHGLIRGPDGRIYFSIGDRGYHLQTKEGKTLSDPNSGAVFRCMPDGSGLEVYATGLRNPQELTFDNYGNLFTGDNNSDSGDRARWVYVLPGSDAGWRMHYQYLPDRGPFNREKIWHPLHSDQPAYIVPPVANFGDGPSGICFNPGTGLGKGFADHFFMCDFRGATATSGIRAFKLKPQGAFFELVDAAEPIWQVLATDVAFGPDGFLYLTDWVNGWVGEGKGRIYRFADPEVIASSKVQAVRDWLARNVKDLSVEELKLGLANQDQRIRFKAQYELAERGEVNVFAKMARSHESLWARLHAVWGMEQSALLNSALAKDADFLSAFEKLITDEDVEVRAQAYKVIGELRLGSLRPQVETALGDAAPRVRMFAALGLRNLPVSMDGSRGLVKMLEENADRDPALRHAAIMGLTAADPEQVLALTQQHDSVSVRRAAVVVFRKLRSPLVTKFLTDSSGSVADEAARSIYDTPLESELTALADCALQHAGRVEFTRRAMNASFRVGRAKDAQSLCRIALDGRFSQDSRMTALQLLGEWNQAKKRDQVTGVWWPVATKDATVAAQALAEHFEQLVRLEDSSLRGAVIQCAETLRPPGVMSTVVDFFRDSNQPPETRSTALKAAAKLDVKAFLGLAEEALASDIPELRVAARQALAEHSPIAAVESAVLAINSSNVVERQEAFEILRRSQLEKARDAIRGALPDLLAGTIAADTRLDLQLAAEDHAANDPEIKRILNEYVSAKSKGSPTEMYRDSLVGGNAERGRKLFHERVQLSCLRCHRVGNEGGYVGPNLSDIGLRKDRNYLLQSIVEPNAVITEKFGSVIVVDESGKTWNGIVHLENNDILRLVTAEGDMVTIAQDEIVDRRDGQSAMPADVRKYLTPFELRDLVEYLALLQGERQPDVESLEIDDQ